VRSSNDDVDFRRVRHPFVPAETCLHPVPQLVDEMPQQASIQQMLHRMLTTHSIEWTPKQQLLEGCVPVWVC